MTDSRKTMTEAVKNAFKSFLFDGILLVVLGVVLLLFPTASLTFLCVVVGAVLVTMGLVKLIFFAAAAGGSRLVRDLVIGIVQMALGLALIIESGFFINLFQVVVGAILVCGALLMIVHGFREREYSVPMFVVSLVFGILILALGIVIIANPAAFANFMVQLQGVALVIEGLALIVVMWKLERDADAVQAELDDREILVVPERVESLLDDDVIEAEVVGSPRGGRTEFYGR